MPDRLSSIVSNNGVKVPFTTTPTPQDEPIQRVSRSANMHLIDGGRCSASHARPFCPGPNSQIRPWPKQRTPPPGIMVAMLAEGSDGPSVKGRAMVGMKRIGCPEEFKATTLSLP